MSSGIIALPRFRRSTKMNRTSRAIPPVAVAQASASKRLVADQAVRPQVSAPSPIVASAAPGQSGGARLSFRLSGTKNQPSAIAAAPTGRLMTKMNGQPA